LPASGKNENPNGNIVENKYYTRDCPKGNVDYRLLINGNVKSFMKISAAKEEHEGYQF
jgi:hypothetical protein